MKVNAANAVPAQQFDKALSDVLMDWYDHEEKEFVKAIDEAADACNDTVKQYAPQETGDYKNSFAISKDWKTKHHYKAEWYVRAPEYRLTHLLENGHLTRDGTSRSKVVKHIKYGKQIAEQVMEERLAGLWGG